MGSDSSRRAPDRYAVNLIREKARQLVGNYGFTESDREDIVQDLTADLLSRLPKFDSSRASWHTFVDRVVNHRVARLIEFKQAAMRDCRLQVSSLSETVTTPSGEEISLEDFAHEDAVRSQHGVAEPPMEDQAALRIDLERAMAALTPEERDLCVRLMTSTMSEIAAAMGIPRPTLYERRRKIQAVFEQAGLKEYL
jgi:RNA polymerase sigma factor (sigma-70 family)